MTVSRSLLIGLIVSAALNVFLVGGVVGVLWVRQTPPTPIEVPPVLPPAAPVAGVIAPPVQSPPQRPPQRPSLPAEVAPSGEKRPPLWTAGRGLSQESRQAMRRTLREANQRNQPIVRQARAERQAGLQAFRAKPYDPAVASQHLAAARALDGQARTNVEASLAAFATKLSAEERAALAQGLEQFYAPRTRPEQQR
ncbi:periplasmic heavy metal sensor [Caulobacter sp. DWR1-3-2b1]|uniref:periplasmic heavy metal sensor n=1 Tax=Caulobacter sp. DWR1-3-2b1 TaxID=2804670 RepID=UPI003CF94EC6